MAKIHTPHSAPTKTLASKAIDAALSIGNGAVTLLSGVLATALIAYSGYVVVDSYSALNKASSSSRDLQQFKPEIQDDVEAPVDPSALKEINDDYRAWLTVYGTSIDYPVMQGENDVFYASHDIYGEPSITGAIYLAWDNSPDFSDSYNMVFGHNVDAGTMFSDLKNMTGDETGVVICDDAIYDVQFFAVVNTDAYEQRIYQVGDRMNDVLDFLRSGGEGGVGQGTEVVYFNEEAAAGAVKLLALSTCSDGQTDSRLVVIGRMTRRIVMKDITVKKVWVDDNNRDGIRPDQLTVTASDGTTAVLNEGNEWTVTVSVRKYDSRGEVFYTWSEENVPGYELTVDDSVPDLTVLTNTHKTAEISLRVRKIWDDNNNQDGARPDTLTVTLCANGAEKQDVTLDAEHGWTADVTGLPEYDNNKKIEYTWIEKKTPRGYSQGESATVTEDDGVVTTLLTNTHGTETVSVTVIKEWHDENDSDGLRPDEITVILKADGEEVKRVTLTESDGWRYTENGLARYRDGKPVSYTWEEVPLEGYETSVDAKGYITVVCNTHTPATCVPARYRRLRRTRNTGI